MKEPEKKLTGRGGPGRKQGRKPKSDAKVAIGVSRVAPDVAARIAKADDRVAFIEALVRAAPPA